MLCFHIRLQLDRQARFRGTGTTPTNTYTPKDLFEPLPSHSPVQLSKRRDTLRRGRGRDYRFGPIRVDWVDFQHNEGEMAAGVSGKERGVENVVTRTVATFTPSTSGSTNLPDGVIHIYRERSLESQASSENSTASTSKTPIPGSNGVAKQVLSTMTADDDITIVAILAIPPWMNPADLLAFVAPAGDGMAHLRLIRDTSPNRTMAIIQFRDAASAKEFVNEFNGQQFNSIEPETCNIVLVRSIRIDMDDPVSLSISRSTVNPSVMHELPTCPVCLDRMDATVTGLVTVPCSHTFHCMCLSKWGDSRCPVCRYSQNALSSSSSVNPFGSPPPGLTSCSECDSRMNLWICLICGNIGCGRQGRAHAKGHFELTSHLYAMELETQRVWDYAGDNYVHRLIQNKADGTLVELPSASSVDTQSVGRSSGQGPGVDDNLKAEKVEIMAMQYSQILQRALDDQRETYEEQTKDLKRKLEDTQRKLEILSDDFEQRVREERAIQERRRKEDDEKIALLEKERQKSERKAERLADLSRKLEKELKEERAVSEGLMGNLAKMKERMEEVDKDKAVMTNKISELEDQMRDVMFFLEAREKIETGQGVESEAAGGTIELRPSESKPSGKGKKKKSGR